MNGASVGQSHPRPRSGKKTLRRCKNNGATDNVVLIDVDSEDSENVIIVDAPESLSKKLRGSSLGEDKQFQRKTVIFIDDDESNESKHPDIGVKVRCNFSNGASSSKRSCDAVDNNENSSDGISDDCQFVRENLSSPVKISKCKRTYSGKAPARNRYGLGPESDDDWLDCDLVEEDSTGVLREQWEIAFLKRKCENRNGPTGHAGFSKTSKVSSNTKDSVGEGNASEKPTEFPVYSCSGKPSYQRGDSSASTVNGSLPQGNTCSSKKVSFADPISKSGSKEGLWFSKADSDHRSGSLAEDSSKNFSENLFQQNVERDNCSPQNPGANFSSWPQHQHSAEEVDPPSNDSQGREKCGLVKEDSVGPLQEQWERDSLKRTCKNRNDQSGIGHGSDASKVPLGPENSVTDANDLEQPKESTAFTRSGKVGSKNDGPSPSTATETPPPDSFPKFKRSFADSLQKSLLKSKSRYSKSTSPHRSGPLAKEAARNCGYGQNQHHKKSERCVRSSRNAGSGIEGYSLNPQYECSADDVDPARKASQVKGKSSPCMSTKGSGEEAYCNGQASSVDEPWSGRSRVNEMDESLSSETTSQNRNLFDYDLHPSTEEVGPVPREKVQERSSVVDSRRHIEEYLSKEDTKSSNRKYPSCSNHVFNRQHEKEDMQAQDGCLINDREKLKETDGFMKVIDEEQTSRKKALQTQAEEAQRLWRMQRLSNCVDEVEPGHENFFSHEKKDDLIGSVHSSQEEHEDDVYNHKSCIINEREKLKDTDEYKKAAEEEWASRQRVLQLQAEEAQQQRRLRKRKKAEHMRLLDMERRQKQRLEEIRETQKKDEEQMNLKESIRAEVRKELSRLEIVCHDMASLLRSLGLQVGPELKPKPDEVRAACKRALFSFHPDRFSKSDVRQQVEAEEKFKLISRMKEKFPVT